MTGMGLANFKLLKEDGENYHLEHPNGKRLTVNKKLLSEDAKKAIQKMCSGGDVKAMSKGGELKKGDAKFDSKTMYEKQSPQHFNHGGDVRPSAGSVLDDPQVQAQDAATAGPQFDPNTQDAIPQGQPAQPQIPEVAAVPQAAPNAAPPSAAPQTANGDPFIEHGMNVDQLLTKEQQDIQDLTNAQTGQAGAVTAAYDKYNKAMDQMKSPNDIMAEYKLKDDALMKDYLNHKIDPDRFVNNMSTGAKIRAGIAMIFGGIGGGLTKNGRNPAMEWLHNSIQNDIAAQQHDEGKSLNLYRMNREAMNDDMHANLATQNQMWTGVQAKIAQAAAAAQGPLAKFRGQQMISQIEQQKIQNRYMLGLMQGGQQGGAFNQADPSMLVGQLVPKELQPKAYEEIGRAQNVAKNKEAILAAFDRAADEMHSGGTGVLNAATLGHYESPGQKALMQLLLPNFKQIDGTVRQAAMDETFKNVVPTGWNMKDAVQSKRQALVNWMQSEMSAPITKGNGIDLSRFASTSLSPVARLPIEQQQIYNWARANPHNEKAQMAIEKFGRMGIK